MSFFAVLFALLIEQLKPLPRDNWVHETLIVVGALDGPQLRRRRDRTMPGWSGACRWWCRRSSWLRLYLAIAHFSLLLALAFDVAVLYLTLGFRQFSHYFTDIRDALDRGDENEARRLLAEWRHLDASELPRTELLRHVIEHALLAAHRHVFGVFFWFVVLSALGLGPVGAVLYRMAEFASRYWGYRARTLDAPANDALMALSRRLFALIDHVPARLTAFGFAVVGNFEEAIDGWRRDAGAVAAPQRGHHPRRGRRCRRRAAGRRAAPGVTPDRSKTFDGGRRRQQRRRRLDRRRSAADRATCTAWSAWCGARWCCGCCWSRC